MFVICPVPAATEANDFHRFSSVKYRTPVKSSKGIKIIQDESVGETPIENAPDIVKNSEADLPSGDFGDIPSYYDESEGVDINEHEESNQTEDDNQTEK